MSALQTIGVFVGLVVLCGWAITQNDVARKKAGAPAIKVNPIAKWLVVAAIAGVVTAGIAWLSRF